MADALMGDATWRGVRMHLDPSVIPPGYAASATNVRFRTGKPEPRKGITYPAWLNQIASGGVQPWGTIYGLGEFRDPKTLRTYKLIASSTGIYRTIAHNKAVAMTLPSGITLAGPVTFTQCFDRVILWRGFDLDPLWMESIHGAWTLVPDPPADMEGAVRIPRGERALFFQNKLWVPTAEDEILYSAYDDPRAFYRHQELRINQGSADRIQALAVSGRSTLLVFKSESVYAIYSVTTDMDTLVLATVSDRYGLAAPETIVNTGSEVWFLSRSGLMAVVELRGSEGDTRVQLKTRTNENGEQVPVLISEDVTPLIDRINWRFASGACAAVVNRCFYLAVPLGNAEKVRQELLSLPVWPHTTQKVKLLPGAWYRFTKGSAGVSVTDGATTYTTSRTFQAVGTEAVVTLTGGPTYELVATSFREVLPGCNTAVLVYDFVAGAWAGWDEADGIEPVRFLRSAVNSAEVLLFANRDGWVGMYEQLWQDAVSQPWIDVEVAAAPEAGDTIEVNGGELVEADPTVFRNSYATTPVTWGTLNDPGLNLWNDDLTDSGGYNAANAHYWSCPNAQAIRIARTSVGVGGGVRFLALNGVLPVADITGDWAEVRAVTHRPVATQLVTRAYGRPDGSALESPRAALDVAVWAAALSVTALAPAVGESELLEDARTWSRVYPDYADAAGLNTAWDATNTDGAHGDPGRQDYSVLFGPDGVAGVYATAGIRLDLHQVKHLEYAPQAPLPRTLQLQIDNSEGRLLLNQVWLSAGAVGERVGER